MDLPTAHTPRPSPPAPLPRAGEGGPQGGVRGPRLFYGWAVVAATFIVLCIGFGIAYSFAAFFQALRDEFHGSRAGISLVFGITGFLYFSLGAVSGPLADRFGPRRVVAAGVLLIAAGVLVASRAQALWQVYLTYSLGVGLGVGFAYVPAISAVQRWFVRRRGVASGLAVAGIGVGNLAMPPLAAALIDHTNWRTAYVLLGLLALALGLTAAALIEHSPQRRGLLPDGAPARSRSPQAADSTTHGDEVGVRAALASRPFKLLYAATAASSLGLFIPFVHLAPYARDHGLSGAAGAWLVALIGVGSTVGRFALGGTADRLGRRRSLMVMFAGMGLSLLWWTVAVDLWALALFALLFGVCYGGFVALIPALTTDYFGGRSAGGIIGLLYTSVAVGTLAGPWLAGMIYDVRESYLLPIVVGAVANFIALGCLAVLVEPARWRAGGHPTG
jgi:MFS family permease